MTGIIFGSTSGNTEGAATIISKKIGESELIEVSTLDSEALKKYDTLLLGCSTWGYGDLQDDWDSKLNILKEANLNGKKIGFFGMGDQEGFPDTYVDALGILYEAVKDSGCSIIGSWPVDGYTFSASQAVIDGEFIGLALDDDNQSDQTEERITSWISSLAK